MRSHNEPVLNTDQELLEIRDQLASREPIFHHPQLGTTRADLEKMTTADFWEVGASGRRYSRKYVIDELEKRYASPSDDIWETSEFYCRKLAQDIYLLTYTLLQGARKTRRSTIWERAGSDWKIVFHQGTVVQE